MGEAPREVEPAPTALPVGPDEQPEARPVAPGGLRRVVTGLGVGVVAGLLVLLDLDEESGSGRAQPRPRMRGRSSRATGRGGPGSGRWGRR